MSSRLPLLIIFFHIVLVGCTLLRSAPTVGGPSSQASAVEPVTLRATGVVEIKSENFKSRAVILVSGPDKVRIDLLGPMRGVAAVLISDGEGIALFSKGDVKRFGWEDPEIPYPFKAHEFASILMGIYGKMDGYEVVLDEEGKVMRLVRSPTSSDAAGGLDVAIGDWRVVEGAEIPFNVVFKNGGNMLAVSYRDVDVNPELSSDLFTIVAGDVK